MISAFNAICLLRYLAPGKNWTILVQRHAFGAYFINDNDFNVTAKKLFTIVSLNDKNIGGFGYTI